MAAVKIYAEAFQGAKFMEITSYHQVCSFGTARTFFIDCPNTPPAFSLPRGRLRGGRVRRAALTIWSFILVNVPFSQLLPLETIILPSNKLNLKAVSEMLWCALQPAHTFLWPGACFSDLCIRCRHIFSVFNYCCLLERYTEKLLGAQF